MVPRSTALKRLVAFVRAFSQEPFCSRCLSERLALQVDAVQEMVRSFRDQPAFIVQLGKCKACGRRATTLMFNHSARAPHCWICGNAITSDADLAFPSEGGMAHRACFIESERTRD